MQPSRLADLINPKWKGTYGVAAAQALLKLILFTRNFGSASN
jgi:hypothetical protein